MKVKKIIDIILWVIVAISAFLIITLFSNINSNNDNDPTMGAWINSNLIWLYILFALCVFIALFFGLLYFVTDFKSAKESLVGILSLLGIGLISYIISSDAIPQFYGVEKFVADGTLTPSVSKWIGAGLISTYFLLAFSIGAMLIAPIMRLFKKS